MDLAKFLEALPRASLSALYASPAACAAVLRGLPPLARLYVARQAHLEGGAPEGEREKKKGGSKQKRQSRRVCPRSVAHHPHRPVRMCGCVLKQALRVCTCVCGGAAKRNHACAHSLTLAPPSLNP